MFSDLLTRLFRDSPDSHDEEAEDPGFATFMATLHARRSAQEWYTPGPEGDLYRQRCRDEEMMRLESRNYGFVMKSPSVSSVSFTETETSGFRSLFSLAHRRKEGNRIDDRETGRSIATRRWTATETLETVKAVTRVQLRTTEAGFFDRVIRYASLIIGSHI